MFNYTPRCLVLLTLLVLQIMLNSKRAATSEVGILRAEIQSCKGCSLNRLFEVRNFVNHDLQKYTWAKFKSIPGASPDLVLFNKENREIQRIALAPYTRRECNLLMEKFSKRLIEQRRTDL